MGERRRELRYSTAEEWMVWKKRWTTLCGKAGAGDRQMQRSESVSAKVTRYDAKQGAVTAKPKRGVKYYEEVRKSFWTREETDFSTTSSSRKCSPKVGRLRSRLKQVQ